MSEKKKAKISKETQMTFPKRFSFKMTELITIGSAIFYTGIGIAGYNYLRADLDEMKVSTKEYLRRVDILEHQVDKNGTYLEGLKGYDIAGNLESLKINYTEVKTRLEYCCK